MPFSGAAPRPLQSPAALLRVGAAARCGPARRRPGRCVVAQGGFSAGTSSPDQVPPHGLAIHTMPWAASPEPQQPAVPRIHPAVSPLARQHHRRARRRAAGTPKMFAGKSKVWTICMPFRAGNGANRRVAVITDAARRNATESPHGTPRSRSSSKRCPPPHESTPRRREARAIQRFGQFGHLPLGAALTQRPHIRRTGAGWPFPTAVKISQSLYRSRPRYVVGERPPLWPASPVVPPGTAVERRGKASPQSPRPRPAP